MDDGLGNQISQRQDLDSSPLKAMLIAVRAVVPAPENGSSTCFPFVDSISFFTRAEENPSLYFIQRNPATLLLSWYETSFLVKQELTETRFL